MNLTKTKGCRPGRFLMIDGETRIETLVASYVRHLRGRAKTWAGSEDEYREWAEKSMRRFLDGLRLHFELDD